MKSVISSVLLVSILLSALALVAGCAGDDSGGGGATAVSGTASAGPINGGVVNIFLTTSTGGRGSLVATTTTNSNGGYSVPVPSVSGPLTVVITGGTYVEEASNTLVSLGTNEITAMLPTPTGLATCSVTPLTHMAAQRAAVLAASGTALTSAISNANQAIALAAGLSAGTDITAISPAHPTKTLASQGLDPASNQAKYALFLATLSQFGKDNGGVDSMKVMKAFAADFSKGGAFTGKDSGGNQLTIGGANLSATSWSTGIATSMNNYVANPFNGGNFTGATKTTPTAAPVVANNGGIPALLAYVTQDSPVQQIQTFTVDQATGLLTHVATSAATTQAGLDHTMVSPNGRCVFAMSQGPAAIISFPVAFGGAIGTPSVRTGTEVTGVESAAVSPDNKFLYVANHSANGAKDAVLAYSISQANCALTPNGTTPSTNVGAETISGPQGISVSPNQKFVVVSINDSTSSVHNGLTSFPINADGTLDGAHVNHQDATNPNNTGAAGDQPGEVTFDPSGGFVYVVNWAKNTVSSFPFNQSAAATANPFTGAPATPVALQGGATAGFNTIAVNAAGTLLYVAGGGGTVGYAPFTIAAGTLTQKTLQVTGTPSNPNGASFGHFSGGDFVYGADSSGKVVIYKVASTATAALTFQTSVTLANSNAVLIRQQQ